MHVLLKKPTGSCLGLLIGKSYSCPDPSHGPALLLCWQAFAGVTWHVRLSPLHCMHTCTCYGDAACTAVAVGRCFVVSPHRTPYPFNHSILLFTSAQGTKPTQSSCCSICKFVTSNNILQLDQAQQLAEQQPTSNQATGSSCRPGEEQLVENN